MCGIAGAILPNTRALEPVVHAMLAPIATRGPDDSGVWCDQKTGIGFGHRRLSILDLSAAGHQPMLSHCGRFVITFNGEIYNFQSIRHELSHRGVAFKGNSDTEVMLAAFEAFGVIDAVQHFRGMFAFVVADLSEQTVYLARDRAGEKPLYYGWAPMTAGTGAGLFFGSDLSALTAGLSELKNERFVVSRPNSSLFLKHGYIPSPHTIYEGIYKLEPGTILALTLPDCLKRPSKFSEFADASERIAPKRYWSFANLISAGPSPALKDISNDDAIDMLDLKLQNVVANQMISDVPLGAFLSGGIDSSTIVAIMQSVSTKPVETFSIGFSDPSYDEAPFANAIAKHIGTNHHELYLNPKDLLDVVPKLSQLFSEPFADSSQIPTYLVAQLARKHVTVSLSGDGGDELFSGYPRLLWAQKLARIRGVIPAPIAHVVGTILSSIPTNLLTGAAKQLSGLLPKSLVFRDIGVKMHRAGDALSAQSNQAMYDQLLAVIDQKHLRLQPGVVLSHTAMTDAGRWPQNTNFGDWLTWADSAQYLPDDILVKVDRCAMAHSLETRVPLLDHTLVEFVYSLPKQLREAQSPSKPLLRGVLARYVPTKLFDRPKMGFSIPVDSWLRGELNEWAEAVLSKDSIARLGVIDPEYVSAIWSEHQSGRANWQAQLWNVLMLAAWFESRKF